MISIGWYRLVSKSIQPISQKWTSFLRKMKCSVIFHTIFKFHGFKFLQDPHPRYNNDNFVKRFHFCAIHIVTRKKVRIFIRRKFEEIKTLICYRTYYTKKLTIICRHHLKRNLFFFFQIERLTVGENNFIVEEQNEKFRNN